MADVVAIVVEVQSAPVIILVQDGGSSSGGGLDPITAESVMANTTNSSALPFGVALADFRTFLDLNVDDVDGLQDELDAKANEDDVNDAINTIVTALGTKADQSALAALATVVAALPTKTYVDTADAALQAALNMAINNILTAQQIWVDWYPVAGSVQPGMVGGSPTGGGSWSSFVPSSATSLANRQIKARVSTGASAGSTAFYGVNGTTYYTGFAANDATFEHVFGQGTNLTGHQIFIGVATNTAALTTDPSSAANIIGVGYDSTDLQTGNWYFFCRGASGAVTKVDTGIPRGISQTLWLRLYNQPNSTVWDVTFMDLSNPGTIFQSLNTNTNTPTAGSAMRPLLSARTGALTTLASIEVTRGHAHWMIS